MKKVIILFAIIVFISCAPKVQDSQLYGKCKIPMYGCTQLLLNKNNTFEFYVFTDVGGENLAKGKWRVHNADTLVLNSYLRPSKEEIEEFKIFSSYSNPEYIVDQLVVLKKNRIFYIPLNKDVKVFSLVKTKLKQRMWKQKPNA